MTKGSIRMFGTTIRAFGIVALLTVPAIAEETEKPGFASAAYSYYCADGAQIEVAYINMNSGLSLAVLHVDDDMLVMENVVSASGARYATVGQKGEDRFVWWTKGDEGFLQQGPDGEEEMVHTACAS
jgi:membrane-bound inhibitor of C-type lysozyme